MIELIDREIGHAAAGRPAHIVFKINAIVDPACIEALYRASAAGVEVDLIVRGICSLQPGVDGISEHIRVRSIVGEFLEHSRIWGFSNGGADEWYIGSADLMERNLDRRIEAVVPVEDGEARARIAEVIATMLADDRRSWQLGADAVWRRTEELDQRRRNDRHVRGDEGADPDLQRGDQPAPPAGPGQRVAGPAGMTAAGPRRGRAQVPGRGPGHRRAPPGGGAAGRIRADRRDPRRRTGRHLSRYARRDPRRAADRGPAARRGRQHDAHCQVARARSTGPTGGARSSRDPAEAGHPAAIVARLAGSRPPPRADRRPAASTKS